MRAAEIFDTLSHGEREHLRENLRKLALHAAGLTRQMGHRAQVAFSV